MARKVDVKLFGYYPEANCKTCQNYTGCGGETHRNDDGTTRTLVQAYGDRIQVSLVNVFSEEMQKYPEVAACIKQNGLLVPIVAIDGKIRLLGSESTMEAIKSAIDAELQKGPLSFLSKRI